MYPPYPTLNANEPQNHDFNVLERSLNHRLREASNIVTQHVSYSVVAGVIPIPLADLAAITGVHVKMINDLSNLYGVPFKEHATRNILGGLLGTWSAATFTSTSASLLKFIPGIGSVAGALALPVVAGATTYAVGRVFISHFESGGHLLDFSPESARNYYWKEYNHYLAEHKRHEEEKLQREKQAFESK